MLLKKLSKGKSIRVVKSVRLKEMSGWEKYAVDKSSQLAKVIGWKVSRGQKWVGTVK